MDPTTITSLTPFGAAGLIAFLWLTERRASAERERQLTQAHERLVRQRSELSLLVGVVRENTRALTALEAALRMRSAASSARSVENRPEPKQSREGPASAA
ncbi:MAG: hypothetical protein KF912_14625 [Phycisphaeraceae bacterium]|nr:hypothetical protein [Phycisphaeraceae bacterium]QYK47538.1 MAG: hypothetical protein KF838_12190 [Phycisphaeraceae bacterium]